MPARVMKITHAITPVTPNGATGPKSTVLASAAGTVDLHAVSDRQTVFTADTKPVSVSLASPNSIVVLES